MDTKVNIPTLGRCLWDGSTLRLEGSNPLSGPRLGWLILGAPEASKSLRSGHQEAVVRTMENLLYAEGLERMKG